MCSHFHCSLDSWLFLTVSLAVRTKPHLVGGAGRKNFARTASDASNRRQRTILSFPLSVLDASNSLSLFSNFWNENDRLLEKRTKRERVRNRSCSLFLCGCFCNKTLQECVWITCHANVKRENDETCFCFEAVLLPSPNCRSCVEPRRTFLSSCFTFRFVFKNCLKWMGKNSSSYF